MDSDAGLTNLAAFRLSRVYAQGWNKAHELSAKDRAQVVLCGADVLNPYAAEPERSRWGDGFSKAFSS
jgi:hypothetical protein